MADENGRLHIVMFPWLAFGHIIPYLQLSKLIAQKGHKVSFVSTPRNIHRLPKLPTDLSSSIKLVSLPLPKVDGLSENAEATIDVPRDKVKYLKIAYDRLREPLTCFLETAPPDWILHDFTPYWLAPIAAKLNVCTAFFSIVVAASLSQFGPPSAMLDGQDDRTTPEDFTRPAKWIPFETTVMPRLFELQRLFHEFTVDDGNVSDGFRFGTAIRNCDAVFLRTCAEFEPEWLKLLGEIYNKPVIPVGFLATTEEVEDENNETWQEMKRWLDKQEKGSVVYVAFGSETKPNQDELTEIALGLELSGLPFLWALRNQRGSADTELTQLPQGFEERTRGRGVVYMSWVPQLKILRHDSVGGLLSHSGWSSTVEAVQFGKALILLPFLADQGLHARLLEEKKMGYPIFREEKDGWFSRDSVAESLRFVIVEDGGKEYRDKVKEMSVLFGDMDKQDRYVNNLLAFLQMNVKKGSR